MEARYRQDYPGEFVVVKSTWADGKKEQQREKLFLFSIAPFYWYGLFSF